MADRQKPMKKTVGILTIIAGLLLVSTQFFACGVADPMCPTGQSYDYATSSCLDGFYNSISFGALCVGCELVAIGAYIVWRVKRSTGTEDSDES